MDYFGPLEFGRGIFCFLRTRAFLFSSQEKFLFVMKNKILFFHFFLVDFESDF